MDSPDDPRAQEELYLTQVIAAIEGEILACGGSVKGGANFSEIGSDDYNARNRMVSQYDSSRRKVKRLVDQRLNPYFGRVDFDDLTDNKYERIYLGSSHLRYKGVDYVCDWRAPVGEIFYQSYGGKTTYRAPIGIVSVNIKLKRRITIKNAELVDVADTYDGNDPNPAIADSLLAEMLKRGAGANMGQIVRSIQAEQDAVIRTTGDIVIVQGPAGSGKTVVALHRAAYLLYQMRQSADPNSYRWATASRMRVFSPNRVFSEYISHVLPDLHEDAIEQDVFEEFLLNHLVTQLRTEGVLKRCKIQRKEEHFEVMLGAVGEDYDHLIRSCREKTSSGIAAELQAYLESEVDAVRKKVRNAAAVDPILPLPDVASRFDRETEELSILERLQRVTDYVKDEQLERKQQLKDWRKLTPREQAKQGILPTHHAALEAEIASVTTLVRGLTKLANEITKRSLIDLYAAFWRQRPPDSDTQAHRLRDETIEALKEYRLAYEDIPPMLYLHGLYRGFPKLTGTVHAIVDECQDYTPLHYEFLRHCLPADCTMTVVGDLNQTVDETISLGGYEALSSIFPGRTKRLDLTRSYRSSLEITEFASHILAGGVHIDNVRRSGRLPELVHVATEADLPAAIVDTVAQMQDREYRQIAIICKSRAEAQQIFDKLHPIIPVSLLTEDAGHIPEGVIVVPIAQAKGLEFDAVLIHNANHQIYNRPADRRLLYTACTRALHELVVLHTGEPSSLIESPVGLVTKMSYPVQ